MHFAEVSKLGDEMLAIFFNSLAKLSALALSQTLAEDFRDLAWLQGLAHIDKVKENLH